ncbi:MAG: ribonuclease P protein component [Oscillospiraceae bacterium]|nr:ribonuclease P protein component [Oscillospiraceae bacterium]
MSDFRKRYVVIKNNRDFSYLFKKGESVVTYGFVCYMRPRRGGSNRLGIVTGKKVGNAVKRNRARRIIREAFRLIDPVIKEKTQKRYDFVFVARGKTPSLKMQAIYSLMKKNILSRLP